MTDEEITQIALKFFRALDEIGMNRAEQVCALSGVMSAVLSQAAPGEREHLIAAHLSSLDDSMAQLPAESVSVH